MVNIYIATSNSFKEGGQDEWILVDRMKAGRGYYRVDLSKYTESKFYKFVIETPYNHLNRWVTVR